MDSDRQCTLQKELGISFDAFANARFTLSGSIQRVLTECEFKKLKVAIHFKHLSYFGIYLTALIMVIVIDAQFQKTVYVLVRLCLVLVYLVDLHWRGLVL